MKKKEKGWKVHAAIEESQKWSYARSFRLLLIAETVTVFFMIETI